MIREAIVDKDFNGEELMPSDACHKLRKGVHPQSTNHSSPKQEDGNALSYFKILSVTMIAVSAYAYIN